MASLALGLKSEGGTNRAGPITGRADDSQLLPLCFYYKPLARQERGGYVYRRGGGEEKKGRKEGKKRRKGKKRRGKKKEEGPGSTLVESRVWSAF